MTTHHHADREGRPVITTIGGGPAVGRRPERAMIPRIRRGTAFSVSLIVLATAPAPQPGVRRAELQRHDLGVPGREVVQVRVELDPGVAFGSHRHPGEEIVYVLEGSLEYRVEGRAATTLGAGGVLFIPAGAVHSARNIGRGVGTELATYLVDKGKPLVEMVGRAEGRSRR